jgi:hypothetical protein
MKKYFVVSITAVFALVVSTPALAQCTKIQSGLLTAKDGTQLTTGFDKYGYNYQAHMFNGLSPNAARPAGGPVMEGTENLVMKWSDDWLANVSCDSDTLLDRGLDAKTGTKTGVSMGWVTNHYEGDYIGNDGELHHYTYFSKIAYVGPAPTTGADPWGGDVSVDGKRIWGSFAIIEEIQSDPYGDYGGRIKFVTRLVAPGLGQAIN